MARAGVTRRTFLALGAGGAAALATGSRWPVWAQSTGPFRHGVASGDPHADRVILWTRVTPSDDAVPGSAVGDPVEVTWEVARDPDFASVVASGTIVASADRDHTVHVDAAGLEPGADHWYRFHALDATSPTGRTRTAPAPGTSPECVRLGIATCAEWEFGFFGAYRHLAARDDIHAVLHLGDYIYEFGRSYGPLDSPGSEFGRNHEPPHEILVLADYRTRYGQYRSDPDLQALHAAHPTIHIWDDHEFANDAYDTGAQNHSPGAEGNWADRSAAARQAWREWTPARQVHAGDPDRIHRSFRFGDLVELWMLDGRQYRDEQAPNALYSYFSISPEVGDPDRTILGDQQESWLHSGLAGSTAAWKVLGNPVIYFPILLAADLPAEAKEQLAPLLNPLLPLPVPVSVEDWNGYEADRQELLEVITSTPVHDLVMLTGDYHESFAADVPSSPGDYRLDGNSVAVEFVAPAITSPGLAETVIVPGPAEAFETNLALGNPWVRYHDGGRNGFAVVEFTEDHTHYDFWYIADKQDPDTEVSPGPSWRSVRGSSRVSEASGPMGPCHRTGGAVTPSAPPAPPAGDDGTGDEARPPATLPATGGDGLALPAVLAGAAAIAARAASRRATESPDDA